MKRIESNSSWKNALHLYKRAQFRLTKGYLDNPEGHVEVEFP